MSNAVGWKSKLLECLEESIKPLERLNKTDEFFTKSEMAEAATRIRVDGFVEALQSIDCARRDLKIIRLAIASLQDGAN